MMIKRLFLVATFVAACALPTAARADVIFTPFLGVSFGNDLDTSRTTLGGSLSFMGPVAGLEFDFANTSNFFGDRTPVTDSNAMTFMANLRFAPRINGAGVQPYFSGGIGLFRSRIEVDSVFDNLGGNDWGFNLGAGIGGYFHRNVGLQGDIRYFRAFREVDLDELQFDVGSLDFWRATIGLTFKF